MSRVRNTHTHTHRDIGLHLTSRISWRKWTVLVRTNTRENKYSLRGANRHSHNKTPSTDQQHKTIQENENRYFGHEFFVDCRRHLSDSMAENHMLRHTKNSNSRCSCAEWALPFCPKFLMPLHVKGDWGRGCQGATGYWRVTICVCGYSL